MGFRNWFRASAPSFDDPISYERLDPAPPPGSKSLTSIRKATFEQRFLESLSATLRRGSWAVQAMAGQMPIGYVWVVPMAGDDGSCYVEEVAVHPGAPRSRTRHGAGRGSCEMDVDQGIHRDRHQLTTRRRAGSPRGMVYPPRLHGHRRRNVRRDDKSDWLDGSVRSPGSADRVATRKDRGRCALVSSLPVASHQRGSRFRFYRNLGLSLRRRMTEGKIRAAIAPATSCSAAADTKARRKRGE